MYICTILSVLSIPVRMMHVCVCIHLFWGHTTICAHFFLLVVNIYWVLNNLYILKLSDCVTFSMNMISSFLFIFFQFSIEMQRTLEQVWWATTSAYTCVTRISIKTHDLSISLHIPAFPPCQSLSFPPLPEAAIVLVLVCYGISCQWNCKYELFCIWLLLLDRMFESYPCCYCWHPAAFLLLSDITLNTAFGLSVLLRLTFGVLLGFSCYE